MNKGKIIILKSNDKIITSDIDSNFPFFDAINNKYLSYFLNKDNFIHINDKRYRILFINYNNIYYLFNVLFPKEKDGIETYEIDYMYDNNYFNPFYLFDDNYFIDNTYNKLRQQDINKYLDNNKKITLINIINAIINKNYPIRIKCDFNDISFIFKMISLILPENYLNDLSISSFDIDDIKIIISFDSNDKNLYNFLINNEEKSYLSIYTIKAFNLLSNSLKSFLDFKEDIKNIQEKKHLSLDNAVRVYQLKSLLIDEINDISVIISTIKMLGNKYDNKAISNVLFNKYKDNNEREILKIYQYIYKYKIESRDFIINKFISFLPSFKNDSKDYIDYINIIKNNIPFKFNDLYHYLEDNNLIKFDNLYDDLKDTFLLLELILDDININNKSFVPNEYLDKFFLKCIELRNTNYLDLTINQIDNYNYKVSKLLIYNILINIKNNHHDFFNYLKINFTFHLLEQIQPLSAARLFFDGYKSTILSDELFLEFSKRKDNDFYQEVISSMKNNYLLNDFLIKLEEYEVINKNINNISDLDEIYNNYYLDNTKRNSFVFITRINEFIKDNYYDTDLILEIYNKYFKDKSVTYKDNLNGIKALYYALFNNEKIFEDIKYYNQIYLIDNLLSKYKIERNNNIIMYFNGSLIKISINDEKIRNDIYNNILKNDFLKLLNEKENQLFFKYYFEALFNSFNIYLNDNIIDKSFILKYHYILNNFDDLLDDNYLLNLINNLNDKNLFLYSLMSITNKNNIYAKSFILYLDNNKKRLNYIKKFISYLEEYISDDKLISGYIYFIEKYINSNCSFLERMNWSLFKKKHKR